MTYWLSWSAAEMRAARTCMGCGSMDADIDLGLCFTCFSRGREEELLRNEVKALRRKVERLREGGPKEPAEGGEPMAACRCRPEGEQV